MSRADEHFERDEWLVSRSPNLYKIMVVEFNTGGANFIPVQQTSARRAAAADDAPAFATETLQRSRQQPAPVRPAKVAQAAALLNAGNYPSDTALNQLAGFLAKRI